MPVKFWAVSSLRRPGACRRRFDGSTSAGPLPQQKTHLQDNHCAVLFVFTLREWKGRMMDDMNAAAAVCVLHQQSVDV